MFLVFLSWFSINLVQFYHSVDPPVNELCYVGKRDILRIIISIKSVTSFILPHLFAIIRHLFILPFFERELLLPWIFLIASLIGFFKALDSLSEAVLVPLHASHHFK